MDHNEQHDDLIDLGSATAETKGIPGDQELDFGSVRKALGAGLSND